MHSETAYLIYVWCLQVKDIVDYAARRFITVVPEIELPGHCGAALACYPHLSCEEPAPASLPWSTLCMPEYDTPCGANQKAQFLDTFQHA